MRLLVVLLFFISLSPAMAQVTTYTFECICGEITGVNCDVCTGTVKGRMFNGLLIRKNGVAHKWIDEPYTVRVVQNNVLQFIELIPNAEQINISLANTPFATFEGFKDSTNCFCEAVAEQLHDTLYVGDGDMNSADILSTFSGQLPISLVAYPGIEITETTNTNGGVINIHNTGDLSVANELQILLTSGDPGNIVISSGNSIDINVDDADADPTNELQNLTLTGQALGISGGTGVTLPVIEVSAGTGIGVSVSAGVATVTNTGDLSTTNEGIIGVADVIGDTKKITSNTSGATGVNIQAHSGLGISSSNSTNGGTISIYNTAPDQIISLISLDNNIIVSGKYPNYELQGYWLGIPYDEAVDTIRNQTFNIIGSGYTSVNYDSSTNVFMVTSYGDGNNPNQNLTLTGQALGISSGTGVTLPVVGVSAGTGIGVSVSAGVATVTNTGDLSTTNEGTLGVAAGIENTSIITSNTVGANGVTLAVGSGLSIAESTSTNGGTITLTNSSPDQTVVLNDGAGIDVTGTYPNFTVTNTGDLSTTNELQTISTTGAAGNITLSNGGGTLNINVNDADASATNEVLTITDGTNTEALGGQTLLVSGAGSTTVGYNSTTNTLIVTSTDTNTDAQNLTLTGQALGISGGTGVTLPVVGVSAGTGIGVSVSAGVATVTNTGDLSATNELQTISVATNTVTLSNSGGTVTIAGAGLNTVSTSGNTITITGTEVDGNISNEGLLGVAAGTGTTAQIITNTAGASPVIISAATGIGITELTGANGGTIAIENIAPDQTVVLNDGAGIDVTGTYPNFTVTNTGDLSATNELQNLTLTGQALGISGGTGVTLPVVGVSAGTGIGVSVSAGVATVSNTGDLSATNELQTISVATNTVTMSNSGGTVTIAGAGSNTVSTSGNTITITGTDTNTDAQNLTLTGQALGISGGTGVTLPVIEVSAGTGIGVSVSAGVATVTNTGDLSTTNELQTISTSGAAGNITLSNGGGTLNLNVNDADASATNELQTLSTATNTVTLSNSGGSFTIAGAGTNTVSTVGTTITVTGASDGDGNSTNELQTISTSGAAGNITLSNGGGTLNLNVNDADASATNEIQNLSLTGQALGISSGTGVTLPIIGITAGTGLTVSTTTGIVTITNTGDLSTTNELQTISRNADNTITMSNSGGTVSVEELRDYEEFTPTSGTTITLTKNIPTDISKFTFERGGLVQTYGAGKSVISINTSTKVVTVTRAFVSGETFIVRFPKQ